MRRNASRAASLSLAACLLIGLAALTGLSGCELTPVECDEDCQANWMDGAPNDSSYDSLDKYHYYRVSKRPDTIPDSIRAAIPVIIAAHGYTASTFEWLEFRRYAGDVHPYKADRDSTDTLRNPAVLVSLVLLGGHGQDIADFEKSTWQQWGAPILDEYNALVAKGYRNISLAGASTGCPLILDHLHRNRMDTVPPNRVFFVDPIIVPTAKLLSLVSVLGPIMGNSPADATDKEKPHWYTNRPQETLNELYTLTNLTKNRLEDGITLPKGTLAKVWKAKKDALADPIGALLLYKGLKTSDGNRIAVQMVDTKKHVFTRLAGRNGPVPGDVNYQLQKKAFDEMLTLAATRR